MIEGLGFAVRHGLSKPSLTVGLLVSGSNRALALAPPSVPGDLYTARMPGLVRITDVSPRDGLQNEPGAIATTDKVRLIDSLSVTGIDEVEVSSFVSPKWVPQLGDAAEVFEAIRPAPGVVYSALVPNERGLDSALRVRAATLARHGRALPDKLSVFTAASQTFSKRNTNASIEESIARFGPVAAACRSERIALRAYVSCIVACPFEGAIAPDAVARVVEMLVALGVDEIDLGDTIGAGTPQTISRVLERVIPLVPAHVQAVGPPGPAEGVGPSLTLHLHDTFGAAASCVAPALECGVRSFDASAGGLGGCPYASTPGRRAPGNISTASLLAAIERAGFTTRVDAGAMAKASNVALAIVEHPGSESVP